MKLPAFQFYPGDWMKDPGLRSVSVAARGLWIDMLCLMFESPRRGYLQLANGTLPTPAQIARMVGGSAEEVSALLQELVSSGVCYDTDHGLMSKRLVRDEQKRGLCSEAGKRGGNPTLKGTSKGGSKGQPKGAPKGLATPPVKPNPTPSSSSSTSSSSSSADQDKEAGGSEKGAAAKAHPPIPPSLDCANFRSEWVKWLEFRKAKGKPVSPLAAAEQFRLCEELGPDQAVQQIRASIRNDWQGLFPPSGNAKGKPAAKGPQYIGFESGEVKL